MSYTTDDFAESLQRVTLEAPVARVLAAWGESPDGYGSWHGGFLLALANGRLAYLTGWCDTTGWGCQDGASALHFDTEPEIYPSPYDPESGLQSEVPPRDVWDAEPVDLNQWIVAGMPES